MKKSIKTGQLLTLFAIVAFPTMLLVFDFTPIVKNYTYSEKSSKGAPKLSGKMVLKKTQVSRFSALEVRAQFVDSVILIPSKKPYVEITGDQVYHDNIEIEMEKPKQRLHIKNKKFYNTTETKDQKNTVIPEEKPGLSIIIGYTQSLNNIVISHAAKKFHQKGILSGNRVHIDVEADEADLTIDANYLYLNLLKPGQLRQFNLMKIKHQYNDYVQQLKQSNLHTVKGKVDLVEIANINSNGHIYLNLIQLQCRQMHANLETSSYNKIIAKPSQLFSYITPEAGRFFFRNELICKSKAKVIHSYRTSEGIIRAQ
ncbi:MAG: DUF2807 domain-containing protein [Haliscomenobacter sp.]|uniref:GIN domain-containing protein n=1 Tax=Haliscomenobacter sp. TaxID=2717303 RepID=UPI0029B65DA4|nr:DUF2807 domain-containing protein [Haliscomenobacter sp.]MDX2068981.1 DUF2807 domain-containing protein [Haliscomenobacter sp.]